MRGTARLKLEFTRDLTSHLPHHFVVLIIPLLYLLPSEAFDIYTIHHFGRGCLHIFSTLCKHDSSEGIEQDCPPLHVEDVPDMDRARYIKIRQSGRTR